MAVYIAKNHIQLELIYAAILQIKNSKKKDTALYPKIIEKISVCRLLSRFPNNVAEK